MTTTAPELAFPILGWRTWDVEAGEDGPTLRSVIHRLRWPRFRAMEARCLRRRIIRPCGEDAPRMRCSCGVYAFRDAERALPYLWSFSPPRGVARVVGRVWLWGTVIECELGWRASRAYPADLVVPVWPGEDRDAAERLATDLAAYGVAVHVVRSAAHTSLGRQLAQLADSGEPACGGRAA